MATELEKIIAEDEDKSKTASDESKEKSGEESSEQDRLDEETRKKEEHLANIQKAIDEANAELKRTRQQAKGKADDDEDIPQINDDDPSAKAWTKRINDNVSPVREVLEKEREEVFSLSLGEFLNDKPALAKDPEKVKRLTSLYERLHEGTGRNKDVVKEELNAAYAAMNHRELIDAARQRKVEDAKSEIEFSEPAIDSGATTYRTERSPSIDNLSVDDRQAIINMYGSVEAYKKTLAENKKNET